MTAVSPVCGRLLKAHDFGICDWLRDQISACKVTNILCCFVSASKRFLLPRAPDYLLSLSLPAHPTPIDR